MTNSHSPWLVQIAEASVTREDLVNGVLGKDTVEGFDDVCRCHREFVQSGWKRCADLEEASFFDRRKIEFRVYKKKFDHGIRWVTFTAAVFMGVWCDIQTFDKVP